MRTGELGPRERLLTPGRVSVGRVAGLILEPATGELGQLAHALAACPNPVGDLVHVDASSHASHRLALYLAGERAQPLLETLTTMIFAHS